MSNRSTPRGSGLRQPREGHSGSGVAVSATKAVPVLVGQQQGAAIGGACGDQHHVVPLEIEVALEVMVDVPGNRWQLAGSENVGEVPNGQIVGLFIIQSSCCVHLDSPAFSGVGGGCRRSRGSRCLRVSVLVGHRSSHVARNRSPALLPPAPNPHIRAFGLLSQGATVPQMSLPHGFRSIVE